MFRTQMRAILRASVHGPVKMMWPMIASLTELKQCLVHFETAKRQLAERDEAYGEVSLGCMIEIPSAALTVGSLLKLVDFISIGTNDLIQYTLSVDRGDDSVSHLYQPGHPAVLKLLQHIIRTANRMGKSVSVCDNGPGVAPEWLSRMKERFARPEGQKQTGSGLGLSIAERIAMLHGLTLSLDNREGGGFFLIVQWPTILQTADPLFMPAGD